MNLSPKTQIQEHADNLLRFRLLTWLLSIFGTAILGVGAWNLKTTLETHDTTIQHTEQIKSMNDQLKRIWQVIRPDERGSSDTSDTLTAAKK